MVIDKLIEQWEERVSQNATGLVRRTIGLLRVVASHPEGIGLSDASRESGIPKATCYRVLSILQEESWVTLDPVTRRYQVSLGMLTIVGGLLTPDGSYRHMQELLQQLADETNETSGFDVLLPPDVMVVAQVPGPALIGQTLKPVPRTQPVWATSTGKVLLAALDPAEVEAQFTSAFGNNAKVTLADFLASLDSVRHRGYASSIGELESDAVSVAAPVKVGGSTPYAVWIGGPAYRITPDRIDALGQSVMAAAERLGRLLSLTGGLITPPISPR
ncbi:IclR family transcriptional regulator [Arthrobacter sp. I2-34]|uniref:IclR family transcriptional regulator n=1 Tax=Arthrobacter hankyongi TaxID=2904801 RepID=A0ABS9L300_9MICC|nr:IclR family transcriptional regulator [Arthrobacter hankyongi]MCG2621072.1 IclR family transcriptional regulator [Arthrobacter hankyongi]